MEIYYEKWKYCPNCKLSLIDQNVENDEEKILEKERNDKVGAKYCIITFLISTVIMFLFSGKYRIANLFLIISLISVIIGYSKYSNNKVLKILFYIFVLIFIFVICFTFGI